MWVLTSAFYTVSLWFGGIIGQGILDPTQLQDHIQRSQVKLSTRDITPYQDKCDISHTGSDMIFDISCFISGTKLDIDHGFEKIDPNTISLKSQVDSIRDDISWFENIYDTESDIFSFSGSEVVFGSGSDYIQILEKLNNTDIDANLYLLIKYGYKLKLTPEQIASWKVKYDYHFVVADRDISKYGECAKTNFRIAFQEMWNRFLQPGDGLDINALFTDLDGYCKWDGEEFMFYQWVCGVSTQVFRLGILYPDLWVYKRQNHNIRYTVYYGDKIVWDDAAIYEDIKKLEIRNDSDHDIYLLTKQWDQDRYYLVAVSPTRPDYSVEVEKQPLTNMSANLKRTINYIDGNIKEDNWFSQYLSVSNDSN